MFGYVQSMFTEPDHAEHAIDCKIVFFFLSCSIAVFHVHNCLCCPSPVSWAAYPWPVQALLGLFPTEWQLWRGPTTRRADVIAALGLVMAAACGTPALDHGLVWVWLNCGFEHVHVMFYSCTVIVYFMFKLCSGLPKSMLCMHKWDRTLFPQCTSHICSVLTVYWQGVKPLGVVLHHFKFSTWNLA